MLFRSRRGHQAGAIITIIELRQPVAPWRQSRFAAEDWRVSVRFFYFADIAAKTRAADTTRLATS